MKRGGPWWQTYEGGREDVVSRVRSSKNCHSLTILWGPAGPPCANSLTPSMSLKAETDPCPQIALWPQCLCLHTLPSHKLPMPRPPLLPQPPLRLFSPVSSPRLISIPPHRGSPKAPSNLLFSLGLPQATSPQSSTRPRWGVWGLNPSFLANSGILTRNNPAAQWEHSQGRGAEGLQLTLLAKVSFQGKIHSAPPPSESYLLLREHTKPKE